MVNSSVQLLKEKKQKACQFEYVSSNRERSFYKLLDKQGSCLSNVNEHLICPDLCPWVQKVVKKPRPKTFQHKLPQKDFYPQNYRFLKRTRYLDRYYQPLTLSYRYYDETECYIEEYRLFKSPSIILADRSVSASSTTSCSSETSCLRCRLREHTTCHRRNCPDKVHRKTCGHYTAGSGSGHKSDSSKAETYINNARSTTTAKRVPIKIPKCETKTRRTIFPIILSRAFEEDAFYKIEGRNIVSGSKKLHCISY